MCSLSLRSGTYKALRQAIELVYLVGANASRRIGEAARQAYQQVGTATMDRLLSHWSEAQNMIDHMSRQEMDAVSSVLLFSNNEDVRKTVDWMREQLEPLHESSSRGIRNAVAGRGVSSVAPPALESKPDARIPVRLTRGPLDFDLPESQLPTQDSSWYASPEFTLKGDSRFELINFIDGKRTVSEIRNALSAEFGPLDTRVVSRYLEHLVHVGVMKWR